MAKRAFPPEVQRVIDATQQKQSIRDVGGFVVVQWQDQYSSTATAIPHASLEAIVGTSTLATIVARYRWSNDHWEDVTV